MLDKDSRSAPALALKAELLLADYKFGAAKETILLISEDEEHLSSKLKLLGQYYSAIRDYKKAEELYEELALRIEPNSVFETNRGVVLHAQGKYKTALVHFREALNLIKRRGNRSKGQEAHTS